MLLLLLLLLLLARLRARLLHGARTVCAIANGGTGCIRTARVASCPSWLCMLSIRTIGNTGACSCGIGKAKAIGKDERGLPIRVGQLPCRWPTFFIFSTRTVYAFAVCSACTCALLSTQVSRILICHMTNKARTMMT